MAPPVVDNLKKEPTHGFVSTLYKCETTDASNLCIYDIVPKLKDSSNYDIGGTYTGSEPDFWFFYTTSPCHGLNLLLNLFVCHRKTGHFTIQISNSAQFTQKTMPDDDVHLVLPKTFETHRFNSTKPDENHFIKTFCFGKGTELPTESILLIPMKIAVDQKLTLDNEVVRAIKLQHDMSGLLTRQEQTDFVLQTATGKQYKCHKIIVAAHSPVLKNMIRNTKENNISLDISDGDMDILLHFIYTGTLKDIEKNDFVQLLDIAEKFQLDTLFLLAQKMNCNKITVENAINMAVMAKKYKLEELKNEVCAFVLQNPKVMSTDAWRDLQDVELTKYLLQYMHTIKE